MLQDGTGHAHELSLSLSLGIGTLKSGAISSSCREETLLDLFAEQALWPSIIRIFTVSYTLMKSLGCTDEAIVHGFWLSKEPAEVFEKYADDGFIQQLVHHSTVSQHGQLKGSGEVPFAEKMREEFRRVAEKRILGGEFERELSGLEEGAGGVQGKPDELYKRAEESELGVGEKRVRERLGMKTI